jgi:hypothetical protein
MDFLRSTLNAFHPSSSDLSPSRFWSGGSDPLARLAQGLEQSPFTTEDSLRKSLEQHRQALYDGQTRDQYLVFKPVPPAVASELSDDASPTSKYCRFSFNAETGILIARICPSNAHERAKRTFDMLIFRELHAMHVDEEVTPLGSTTVTVGDWTKEADCCWAPDSTPTRLTFVVEVGLFESEQQLAFDADSWLETLSSSVKLVVTISINRESPEIILNRWELIPRRSDAWMGSPPFSVCRTAFVKIIQKDDVTSVTGESCVDGTTTTITQLDLPFEKIVDRSPCQPLERDLSISEHRLKYFAECIWIGQNLIP